MPDQIEAVKVVGDALHDRMVYDDLWGVTVENVDRYADAAVAIAALRGLPVEQRMKAMGMVEREYFCNIVWTEAPDA